MSWVVLADFAKTAKWRARRLFPYVFAEYQTREVNMSKVRSLARIVLSLLIVVGVARGQSQFGSIAGHVTDPSQAVVPGAEVRATNEATNVTSSASTSGSGTYVIPGLLPGMYTVSVQGGDLRSSASPASP
jgi:hypothetical protein